MATKKQPPVKDLSQKPVEKGHAGAVKGGRSGKLAANHNQTLR